VFRVKGERLRVKISGVKGKGLRVQGSEIKGEWLIG
jgi:hypothetical protein